MRENPLWYICGGPKNNGRFGYVEHGKFRTGLNHLPTTKNSRVRYINNVRKQERREGHGPR